MPICVYFLFAFTFAIVKCINLKALGDILLSESYKTCHSLDLKQDHVSCEIHSEENENNIVCFGLSNCKMTVTLCPDGSINKTCFPLRDENSLSYQCICHYKRRAEFIASATEWTTWTPSTNPYQSFKTERSLIVPNLEWVVLQEFSHFLPINVYIISHYQLTPSSVYSASSTHSDVYEPEKASIDTILSQYCSWAAKDDPSWLQMTLPTEYVVVGALIKQRCDTQAGIQYATRVQITRSVDGVTWQTVIESEALHYDSYNGQGSCSVWFPQAYTDRFWRIHILDSYGHPSMRADLIGYK